MNATIQKINKINIEEEKNTVFVCFPKSIHLSFSIFFFSKDRNSIRNY